MLNKTYPDEAFDLTHEPVPDPYSLNIGFSQDMRDTFYSISITPYFCILHFIFQILRFMLQSFLARLPSYAWHCVYSQSRSKSAVVSSKGDTILALFHRKW